MENGGRPIAEEEYTRQTRAWLDRRYRLSDLCGELDHEAQSGGIRGVYHAHQPVYGVWGSCCEPGRIQRYALSWHLLEALRRISFSTLLDVGAAEGFTQELIRSHFSARTFGADLSAEGCLRARGIFQTDSAAADVHRLPFRENSVDVVLCSETLEHVPDPERALEEMLRVARVAVVLSIPLEAEEIIAANRRDQVAHAHIHRFTAEAFESLRRPGLEVECRPVLSGPFLELARSLEALRPLAGETEPGRSRFGEMLRQALPLDGLLIAQGGSPHGWIVVLRKKAEAKFADDRGPIDASDILLPARPPHCLAGWTYAAWQSLPADSGRLLFHFDRLEESGSGLRLAGWGFLQGCSAEFQRLAVAFDSRRKYYLLPAQMTDRPDVGQHFASAAYLHCGFELFVPWPSLPPGEYRLELVCHNQGLAVRRRTEISRLVPGRP